MRCRDGSRRWFIWNVQRPTDFEGAPAVLKVGRDITALKQTPERTQQAERLAASGQMTAGLAYESGNVLARSQACLKMLQMEVENRLAACSDLVEITVICSAAQLDGQAVLRIAVRDNGPGLNVEQQQHIFEPFFTTKTKSASRNDFQVWASGVASAPREQHSGR